MEPKKDFSQEVEERAANFWSVGNELAARFDRSDLILTPEERLAQVRVRMLDENAMAFFQEEGLSEQVERLNRQSEEARKDEVYRSGRRKMAASVSEILEGASSE